MTAGPRRSALAAVFASRILDGLFGGNISRAQSYITDVTVEKDRARSLGTIGAAFGIGFIIGPALGGLLSRWGHALPAFAAAGLCLVNLVWVLAAVPESLTPERRAELSANPRPPVTARALIAALRRPLVAPLVKRYTEPRLIVAAAALMAVSLLAWGFVARVWLLLVVLAPLSLAAGILNTVLSSALTKAMSRDEVGGTLGLSTALQSAAGTAAPSWAASCYRS